MNKKILIVISIFVAVMLSGVLAYEVRQQSSKVRVNPHKGSVVESIYGLGTVTAERVFHFRGGLPLSIRKLFVKEGQTVKMGTPLVLLDGTIVRSPIEGTVTEVAFKEGELIPANVPAITVNNLKNLYLEVSLEQQSILRVKPNQIAAVSFESLRSEKVEGTVRAIFPKLNQFIVRIELSKWPEGVLPGMTADIAILVGQKNDVLLIPIKSILAGRVIRIRNGKKEKVPVQLGVIDGQWAEVVSDNISVNDELLMKRD